MNNSENRTRRAGRTVVEKQHRVTKATITPLPTLISSSIIGLIQSRSEAEQHLTGQATTKSQHLLTNDLEKWQWLGSYSTLIGLLNHYRLSSSLVTCIGNAYFAVSFCIFSMVAVTVTSGHGTEGAGQGYCPHKFHRAGAPNCCEEGVASLLTSGC